MAIKTVKHPCGCVSEKDRERWVYLCPPHEADELIFRAEAERGHAVNREESLRRELA
jgi:hypothetical protein